jgi:hypothetical protein
VAATLDDMQRSTLATGENSAEEIERIAHALGVKAITTTSDCAPAAPWREPMTSQRVIYLEGACGAGNGRSKHDAASISPATQVA